MGRYGSINVWFSPWGFSLTDAREWSLINVYLPGSGEHRDFHHSTARSRKGGWFSAEMLLDPVDYVMHVMPGTESMAWGCGLRLSAPDPTHIKQGGRRRREVTAEWDTPPGDTALPGAANEGAHDRWVTGRENWCVVSHRMVGGAVASVQLLPVFWQH